VKTRALFIFEASPEIGGGHASRCVVLADALSRSIDVGFAVNTSAIPMLGQDASRVVAVFKDGRPSDIVAMLLDEEVAAPDLILLDHYGLHVSIEGPLGSRGSKIVVIDDLADRFHIAHVLIDSNPGRRAQDYSGRVSAGCRLLLGSDYALLRPEFRNRRTMNQDCERSVGESLAILVSLGATDPANATAGVLADLSRLQRAISVTVVLGQAAPHIDRVRELLPALPFPTTLIVGASNMSELYCSHGLAIGAPATSALERACLGLPSLLIVTADNQVQLGEALHATGAAELIGAAGELAPGDIAMAIDRLTGDVSRMAEMSGNCYALVDGLGVRRVAANLSARFVSRRGEALIGRRLRGDDSDVLYEWQMDPTTRTWFRNPRAPTRGEHDRFIAQRLRSRDAISEIIECEGRPAALVRADPGADNFEVSIVVAPGSRGNGIGRASLAYLADLLPDARLTASVDERNAASLALFRNSGYLERDGARFALNVLSGPPPSHGRTGAN
jgi:UDP-2,4-diacetamido-2,4,6-trideoxy-beta-L-altropyranose hydrolase